MSSHRISVRPSSVFTTPSTTKSSVMPIGIVPSEYNVSLFRRPAERLKPEEMDSYLANPVDAGTVVPPGMENNNAFAGGYNDSNRAKHQSRTSPKLNGGYDAFNRGWLIEALEKAYTALFEDYLIARQQSPVAISSQGNQRGAGMLPEIDFRTYLSNLRRNANISLGKKPDTTHAISAVNTIGTAGSTLGSVPAEGAGWSYRMGVSR